MKSLWLVAAAAALFAIGCVETGGEEPTAPPRGRGKADTVNFQFIEGEQYSYVLGKIPSDPQCTGAQYFPIDQNTCQIRGGGHQVLIPSENPEGGREAIDPANEPTRLHQELKDDHRKYDASITEGHSTRTVFASTWWPQSKNGIAWRWNSSTSDLSDLTTDPKGLSPAEKYDVLYYPDATEAQKRVAKRVNWPWKEMKKPESERDPSAKREHPAVVVAGPVTKWELEHHGKYQRTYPDGWWGHCNGWASYTTVEPLGFPKRDICIKLVDNKVTDCLPDQQDQIESCGDTAETQGCILFRMADMEGLMTELYFSDAATFAGRRCNEEPDEMERDEYGRPKNIDCRDINAGTFHAAVTGLLGRGAHSLFPGDDSPPQKLPFVIDHNYDYQVWNFPLTDFEIDTNATKELKDDESGTAKEQAAKLVGEGTGDYSKFRPNPNTTRYIQVKMKYWMVSDGVPAHKLKLRADLRGISKKGQELNYILELDNRGKILGGEWIKAPSINWGPDNKKLHPDFLWMAVKAQGRGEGSDDLGGNNDNPHLAYSKVAALMRCANSPESCRPEGGGGGGGGQGPQTLLDKQGESVAKDETKTHSVAIPDGGSKLVVTMKAVSGDPDLKIAYGGQTCYPYKAGDEKCEFANPAAGTMEVQVIGYSAATYDLKAVLEMGSGGGNPPPTPACTTAMCGEKSSNFDCYCDTQCKNMDDCCQEDGSKGSNFTYVKTVCNYQ